MKEMCYNPPEAIRREMIFMAGFVPKNKLSKKAQKELNRQRRVTWDFSPVTKTVESKKIYSRKRKAQNRDDYGLSFFDIVFFFILRSAPQPPRRIPA